MAYCCLDCVHDISRPTNRKGAFTYHAVAIPSDFSPLSTQAAPGCFSDYL